jgi:hypothetical protein
MDVAYCQLHTNMTVAITCITIIDDIACLLLQVPFGASPAPTKISSISDMAADECIQHAVPLILETMFRVKDSHDPTNRDPIINLTKHKTKGKLEVQMKIILGWLIDSHKFKVFLTKDKATECINETKTCIQKGTYTRAIIESLIGCFNDTSMIIHIGCYFLTRLRYCLNQYKCLCKNRQTK